MSCCLQPLKWWIFIAVYAILMVSCENDEKKDTQWGDIHDGDVDIGQWLRHLWDHFLRTYIVFVHSCVKRKRISKTKKLFSCHTLPSARAVLSVNGIRPKEKNRATTYQDQTRQARSEPPSRWPCRHWLCFLGSHGYAPRPGWVTPPCPFPCMRRSGVVYEHEVNEQVCKAWCSLLINNRMILLHDDRGEYKVGIGYPDGKRTSFMSWCVHRGMSFFWRDASCNRKGRMSTIIVRCEKVNETKVAWSVNERGERVRGRQEWSDKSDQRRGRVNERTNECMNEKKREESWSGKKRWFQSSESEDQPGGSEREGEVRKWNEQWEPTTTIITSKKNNLCVYAIVRTVPPSMLTHSPFAANIYYSVLSFVFFSLFFSLLTRSLVALASFEPLYSPFGARTRTPFLFLYTRAITFVDENGISFEWTQWRQQITFLCVSLCSCSLLKGTKTHRLRNDTYNGEWKSKTPEE